ncbi:MAG TPA: hypothetical protein VF384_19305 [Planctomycetota bacterium]
MKRERGKPGQFDVVVDGEVIASRGGSMLERLLKGGWPDPEAVVAKIEAKRKQKA